MRPFVWIVGLWLAPLANAGLVDRVVVVVGDQLVLESEISLEAELSRLDASPVPYWDATVQDPLDGIVDALVLRASAGDVDLYEPPPEQIGERLERLRLRFEDRVDWQAALDRWGMDEVALAGWLRRRMIVERFLLRNLQVAPQDREAWLAAADRLVDQLRPRYRIRVIEPRGQP